MTKHESELSGKTPKSPPSDAQHEAQKWHFWIDRGGTFTDLVARDPQGELHQHKLLSENPGVYDDAAVQGIRNMMGLAPQAKFPESNIACVKMGTTVATNALLERKGEPTALLITQGFRDALWIGDQTRPHLFQLDIPEPEMIYHEVQDVAERLNAQGEVITELNEEDVRQQLAMIRAKGIQSVAVVLMHAYFNPDHEQRIGKIARAEGFSQVSLSHEASPLIKLIGRGDTTVVDAYLSPVLKRYVESVRKALGNVDLRFMMSSGGLTQADTFRGKDAILSGPAGGIVGAVKTAESIGESKLITFDMGGTSTDVAHYAGQYERQLETRVANVRLRVPMLQIHTVAAGGGSICKIQDGQLKVGPESAGANPGPACYGKGGPLTVTDCNVVLGKLQPQHFPNLFGPQQNQALNRSAAFKKCETLCEQLNQNLPYGETEVSVQGLAEGFLQVAVQHMSAAIKTISTQKGYDVKDYTLQCFGGAGGQHACLVAQDLGMKNVLIHPYAGVLSAYGMGCADDLSIEELQIADVLSPKNLEQALKVMKPKAMALKDPTSTLHHQHSEYKQIEVHLSCHLHYPGSDQNCRCEFNSADLQAWMQGLPLDLSDVITSLKEAFTKEHRQSFGFTQNTPELILEILECEVRAIGASEQDSSGQGSSKRDSSEQDSLGQDSSQRASVSSHREKKRSSNPQRESVELIQYGKTVHAPVWMRSEISPFNNIKGPAVIVEPTATTIVESGWVCESYPSGELMLRSVEQPVISTRQHQSILLELFNHQMMSIAEQMGAVLQKSAFSVNIKERQDFSCAVFAKNGDLICNAPHMPVHLGSMAESVRQVNREHGDQLEADDSIVLNDPYGGGTHIPDVTVVTPLMIEGECQFYLASRGHHADMGGVSPGSMPSASTSIHQEGVLIRGLFCVKDGIYQEDALRQLLCNTATPVRNFSQNSADLKAQIAANEKGKKECLDMIQKRGLKQMLELTQLSLEQSARLVQARIATLKDGEFKLNMDNGSHIMVKLNKIDRQQDNTTHIEPHQKSFRVDFTGTSPQGAHNFHAPAAVTRAAVLYVFRTLVSDDIPLNEGCMWPIDLILPEDSLLNPSYPAAVVAGNVETSQAVVNALYGALGVVAASQGTMNNVTFGDERFQYYETVCGGTGAGETYAGRSAVQGHMTNSKLTDPEILEHRFPIRVQHFGVRRGSGGQGQHRGGDGAQRELMFLEPMELNLLSQSREVLPFGLNGGKAAQGGEQWIQKSDGTRQELSACEQTRLDAGDVFHLLTPGGGGFGSV